MGTFRLATSSSPDGGTLFSFYERSVAAGYARSFGQDVSIGIAGRYSWMSFPPDKTPGKFLVSAGISYRPEWLDHRLQAGFSLMNFGTPMVYPASAGTETEPANEEAAPAQMLLGTTMRAASSPGFNLDLSVGLSKPIATSPTPPAYTSESSFSALFSSWSHSPEDLTTYWGLSFGWQPIQLADGISLFQEFTLGFFSAGKGSYSYANAFFTHGASMGIEVCETRVSAGYAGRWHNAKAETYFPWSFPWETFEISVRTTLPSSSQNRGGDGGVVRPHRIVLTASGVYPTLIGRFKSESTRSLTYSFSSTPIWGVEADFYLTGSSALITTIEYNRLTERVDWIPPTGHIMWDPGPPSSTLIAEFRIESFSIESGFRYHPTDEFSPLFAQISMGISRLNPVDPSTTPRYSYQSFDRLTLGAIFAAGLTPIVIMPKVSLRTLWTDGMNRQTLVGRSQWEFGMNVGLGL